MTFRSICHSLRTVTEDDCLLPNYTRISYCHFEVSFTVLRLCEGSLEDQIFTLVCCPSLNDKHKIYFKLILNFV